MAIETKPLPLKIDHGFTNDLTRVSLTFSQSIPGLLFTHEEAERFIEGIRVSMTALADKRKEQGKA